MEVVTFETEDDFFDAIDGNLEHNGEPLYVEYKEDLDNFDSEKGMVDVTVYLQRKSDNKKFVACYTRGGAGNRWADEDNMTFDEIVTRVKKPSLQWSTVMEKFIKETPKELRTDKDTILEWLSKNLKPPQYKK